MQAVKRLRSPVNATEVDILGPPDVYPQQENQEEDIINAANVSNGLSKQYPVKEPFKGWDRDRAFIQLQDIAARATTSLNRIVEHRRHRYRKEHEPVKEKNTTRMSPVELMNESSWLEALAGRVPFQELTKEVCPYYNKKSQVLEKLNRHCVPFNRATWYIKIVMKHEETLRKSTGSSWLIELCGFLDSLLARMEGGTSKEKAAQDWCYLRDLTFTLLDMNLLDINSWLSWALNKFENSQNLQQIRLLLPVILRELQIIKDSPKLLACLHHACHRLLLSAESSKNVTLRSLLLRILEDNSDIPAIIPQFTQGFLDAHLHGSIDECSSEPLLLHLGQVWNALESFPQAYFGRDPDSTLYLKIFGFIISTQPNDIRSYLLRKTVYKLCEWVVLNPKAERIHVVVGLFLSYCNESRPKETVAEPEVLLSQYVLDFIVAHQNVKERLWLQQIGRLIGIMMEKKLLKKDILVHRLVTAAKRNKSSFENNVHNVLIHMPIYESFNHFRAERRSLIYGPGRLGREASISSENLTSNIANYLSHFLNALTPTDLDVFCCWVPSSDGINKEDFKVTLSEEVEELRSMVRQGKTTYHHDIQKLSAFSSNRMVDWLLSCTQEWEYQNSTNEDDVLLSERLNEIVKIVDNASGGTRVVEYLLLCFDTGILNLQHTGALAINTMRHYVTSSFGSENDIKNLIDRLNRVFVNVKGVIPKHMLRIFMQDLCYLFPLFESQFAPSLLEKTVLRQALGPPNDACMDILRNPEKYSFADMEKICESSEFAASLLFGSMDAGHLLNRNKQNLLAQHVRYATILAPGILVKALGKKWPPPLDKIDEDSKTTWVTSNSGFMASLIEFECISSREVLLQVVPQMLDQLIQKYKGLNNFKVTMLWELCLNVCIGALSRPLCPDACIISGDVNTQWKQWCVHYESVNARVLSELTLSEIYSNLEESPSLFERAFLCNYIKDVQLESRKGGEDRNSRLSETNGNPNDEVDRKLYLSVNPPVLATRIMSFKPCHSLYLTCQDSLDLMFKVVKARNLHGYKVTYTKVLELLARLALPNVEWFKKNTDLWSQNKEMHAEFHFAISGFRRMASKAEVLSLLQKDELPRIVDQVFEHLHIGSATAVCLELELIVEYYSPATDQPLKNIAQKFVQQLLKWGSSEYFGKLLLVLKGAGSLIRRRLVAVLNEILQNGNTWWQHSLTETLMSEHMEINISSQNTVLEASLDRVLLDMFTVCIREADKDTSVAINVVKNLTSHLVEFISVFSSRECTSDLIKFASAIAEGLVFRFMVISKILVGKLKHKRESVELAKEAWKQICKTLDLLETVTPLFDRQIQAGRKALDTMRKLPNIKPDDKKFIPFSGWIHPAPNRTPFCESTSCINQCCKRKMPVVANTTENMTKPPQRLLWNSLCDTVPGCTPVETWKQFSPKRSERIDSEGGTRVSSNKRFKFAC
eukprot:m.190097 g.190097  ORF g.190097 m.190097 type:complete len:1444 (-) comp15638_c0_seq3:2313-6644(-)